MSKTLPPRSPWIQRRQRLIGFMRGAAVAWIFGILIHRTPHGVWDVVIPCVLMVAAILLTQLETILDVDQTS